MKLVQRKRKIYVNELLKCVDKIRKNMKACCFVMNANDVMESKSDDRDQFHEDYDCSYGKFKGEGQKIDSLIKILENPQHELSDFHIKSLIVILAV